MMFLLTNFQGCFFPAVQKLAGIKAFRCDKKFFTSLKLVRVPKMNDSQRSTSSGIMDDVLRKKKLKFQQIDKYTNVWKHNL